MDDQGEAEGCLGVYVKELEDVDDAEFKGADGGGQGGQGGGDVEAAEDGDGGLEGGDAQVHAVGENPGSKAHAQPVGEGKEQGGDYGPPGFRQVYERGGDLNKNADSHEKRAAAGPDKGPDQHQGEEGDDEGADDVGQYIASLGDEGEAGEEDGGGDDQVQDSFNAEGGDGGGAADVVTPSKESELGHLAKKADGDQVVEAQAYMLHQEEPAHRYAVGQEELLPSVGAKDTGGHENGQGDSGVAEGEVLELVLDDAPLDIAYRKPAEAEAEEDGGG